MSKGNFTPALIAASASVLITTAFCVWAYNSNEAFERTAPSEVNSVPRGLDAKTAHAQGVDTSRLKASLQHAKDLVAELKSTNDEIEQERITRQINTAVKETTLEKSDLQKRAKSEKTIAQNTHYHDLMASLADVERNAKHLPSGVGNFDQSVSQSLQDAKAIS
ncbi:MAG: hypothetical protein P4M08_07300 [Oligoflexia bacterium]|nr:hypothetical protein [Oligoflexia bacterium]